MIRNGQFSRFGAAAFVAACLAGGTARSEALNPLNFASLGAFPTASSIVLEGTRLRAGDVTVQGVTYNGIRVFTFDAIQTGATIELSSFGNVIGGPVAFLSHTDIEIGGQILWTAPTGSGPGSGSGGRILTYREPGVPATVIGEGGPGGASYGGLGSPGSTVIGLFGSATGGAPGATNYDPANPLKMGSSGFSSNFAPSSRLSGRGGGAIEFGAVGTVEITETASIAMDGGTWTGSPGSVGSGGSGGSIYLHGEGVQVQGLLSVLGGAGSPGRQVPEHRLVAFVGGGGAGGGGAVTIETGSGGFSGSLAQARLGGGVLVIDGQFIAGVPEPSSLAMAGLGLSAAMLWGRRRFRRR